MWGLRLRGAGSPDLHAGFVVAMVSRDQVGLDTCRRWALARGLGLADRATGADPNRNGRSNHMEFAYNTDPVGPGLEGEPFAVYVNGILRIVHRFHRFHRDTGLSFDYEWSRDLRTWSDSSVGTTVLDGDVDGDGTTELRQGNVVAAPGRVFACVKVSER